MGMFRPIRKAARKTSKGFKKAANNVGRRIEATARKTGKGVGKAAHQTGRHIEKATRKTGKGLNRAAHQMGRGIEKTVRKTKTSVNRTAHQTGRAFENVSRETAKGLGKAARETGKGLKQTTRKTEIVLETIEEETQNVVWSLGIGRKGKIFPRLNTSYHYAGTHVFVSRGAYEHHGIYVGDGKVVEYNNSHGVRVVRLSKFRRGTTVYVQRYSRKQRAFSYNQIVERALGRVNEKNYDVVVSNCEHLARWCVTGKAWSPQSLSILDSGVSHTVRMGLRTTASQMGW